MRELVVFVKIEFDGKVLSKLIHDFKRTLTNADNLYPYDLFSHYDASPIKQYQSQA